MGRGIYGRNCEEKGKDISEKAGNCFIPFPFFSPIHSIYFTVSLQFLPIFFRYLQIPFRVNFINSFLRSFPFYSQFLPCFLSYIISQFLRQVPPRFFPSYSKVSFQHLLVLFLVSSKSTFPCSLQFILNSFQFFRKCFPSCFLVNKPSSFSL